jgi:hypothetical protein
MVSRRQVFLFPPCTVACCSTCQLHAGGGAIAEGSLAVSASAVREPETPNPTPAPAHKPSSEAAGLIAPVVDGRTATPHKSNASDGTAMTDGSVAANQASAPPSTTNRSVKVTGVVASVPANGAPPPNIVSEAVPTATRMAETVTAPASSAPSSRSVSEAVPAKGAPPSSGVAAGAEVAQHLAPPKANSSRGGASIGAASPRRTRERPEDDEESVDVNLMEKGFGSESSEEVRSQKQCPFGTLRLTLVFLFHPVSLSRPPHGGFCIVNY